jgi:hypothetical protein
MLLCFISDNKMEAEINIRLFYIFQSKTGQITVVEIIRKNDIVIT